MITAMVIWLLFSLLVLMSLKDKNLSDILGWIGVGTLVVVVLNTLSHS